MTDIIERLEAAEEGSREANALLWRATHEHRERAASPGGRVAIEIPDRFKDADGIDRCEWDFYCWADQIEDHAPAYTTSLDAKLPWESIVFVQALLQNGDKWTWNALHRNPDGSRVSGLGNTEALAR